MVMRLNIFMNGEHVGVFERTNAGAHHFRYVEAWLDSPHARPISLSMPWRLATYTGDVVINFFDNLLPDNPKTRERIASRFRAEIKQPFDLLSKSGVMQLGRLHCCLKTATFPATKHSRRSP